MLAGDCAVCPGVAPASALEPLREAVVDAYRAAGRCAPCEDVALSAAADKIAAGPGEALPDALTRQRLVQEAGGGDPTPRALMADAASPAALGAVLKSLLAPEIPDNVIGLGLAARGDGFRAVVLQAQRKVVIDPLPTRVERQRVVSVHGHFLTQLTDPALFVEGPDGKVTQLAVSRTGAAFHGDFVPVVDGRYLIEVMAHGARGPEVEYLHPVLVGVAAREPTADVSGSGPDDAAAVLDAINSERQRYSAATLSQDPRLARIAKAYAEEMRAGGFFGHVSPRSGDLAARLKRAGYRYRAAGENLAEGPSALEAHALAANSPAHRKTMLDPLYNRCGIGISRVLFGDGRPDVLLVEVFALDQP